MRISDWSSDVCSSDLKTSLSGRQLMAELTPPTLPTLVQRFFLDHLGEQRAVSAQTVAAYRDTLRLLLNYAAAALRRTPSATTLRSEEHTSELQSLMRISYAVFCLKKKKQNHLQRTNISNSY